MSTRKPSSSSTPSSAPKNDKAPKDLITLTNARNGETYKFACRTCIDGHRAPLCDPKKHRGKILYRRPAPGRPARQCGHPKSSQCDCLAKRTLCCILTDSEWDRVQQGEIIKVDMYDNNDKLEEGEARKQALATGLSSENMPDLGPNFPQQQAMPFRQPSVPRLAMLGVGGPHGDDTSRPDAFSWDGQAPPLQSIPNFTAVNQNFNPHFGSNYSMAQATPSTTSTQWQGRPELMNFYQPQLASGLPVTFGDVNANQPNFGPHTESYQSYPTAAFSPLNAAPMPLDPPIQSHTYNNFSSQLSGAPLYGINMAMQESFAGLSSHEPTQACSSQIKQPRPMQTSQTFTFPRSEPRNQFPCANCASTECTCNSCPEVRQLPERNGAWAAACGRGSHLNARAFIPAAMPPMSPSATFPLPSQQQQSILHAQQFSTTPEESGSCCSRGASSSAAVPPKHESPQMFEDPHDVMLDDPGFVNPSLLDNTGVPCIWSPPAE